MTRLKKEDVYGIAESLNNYNDQLIHNVGKSLAGIAAHAIGESEQKLYASHGDIKVAVVPVTSGQGIINGFSESVQKIIEFMGYVSFVTDKTDVGGLAEAVSSGAQVVFLADDEYFVAINLLSHKVVDNGLATGRGYAAALDLMTGGIREHEVLVLGAGPVGMGAAEFMALRGARVYVYDIENKKSEALKGEFPEVQVVYELEKSLENYKYLLDATPAQGFIASRFLSNDTMVAAPGIPLGLGQDSMFLIADRLVHDKLEIGVATMLMEVIS